MKSIRLGNTGPASSRLAYGCMRIAGDGGADASKRGKQAIHAAVDAGYTLFDHADIYSAGHSEALFGEVLRESPGLRSSLTVLTKCGIRMAGEPDAGSPQRYDFSSRHLQDSVDGSLQRLGIEQIDVLLLHRPDWLADFSEVAEVFDRLHAAGKVLHFGVSNFSPSQVRLLQSISAHRLVAHQVEINLHNLSAFTNGTLDQCAELGMTPQAWCPVAVIAYPAWANTFSDEDVHRLLSEVNRQAEDYAVSPTGIALAWLLRHPSGISPIIGSTTPERIREATQALEIDYRAEDWYRLLEARNAHPVP